MEPSLRDIDDYYNNESPQKRKTVNLVVLLLFLAAMLYGGFKLYYDTHMPSSFNPVVTQEELSKTRGY